MNPCQRWLVVAVCLLAGLACAQATEAATCRWTGGGLSRGWSAPANWDNCGGAHPIPQSGDDLTFPAGVRQVTINNDLPGLTIGQIVIEATAGTPQYVIGGEGITLATGLRFVGTTHGWGQGFLAPIAIECVNFNNVRIEHLGGPDTAMLGSIDLGGDTCGPNWTRLYATNAPVLIDGQISGHYGGDLFKYGSYDLVLAHDNSYTGAMRVMEGNLDVRTAYALGPNLFGGETSVRGGASLTVAPGLTIGESISSWGDTTNLPPSTIRLRTGEATLTGTLGVNLEPELAFVVDAGATLHVEGAIQIGLAPTPPRPHVQARRRDADRELPRESVERRDRDGRDAPSRRQRRVPG
jgi:hypothetical protein